MKRKFYVYLFIVFTLFMFCNVSADTCPSSEMDRLKNLANKIEYSRIVEWDTDVGENGEYKYPRFYINMQNLNKELRVFIENTQKSGEYLEIKGDSEGKGSVGPFYKDQKANITIRAYTANACSGKVVTTKTIKMPYLNLNSYDPICSEYIDFEYCKEFLDESITEEEFGKALSIYLKNRTSNYTTNNENKNSSFSFSNSYVLAGIIAISVILITLVIVFIIRKRKKNQI